MTERWKVLPTAAKYVVAILPVIGSVLFLGGATADAQGWSSSHGFLVNAASSAMAFCFGVPIVILVLQELSESSEASREKYRLEKRTANEWKKFTIAVRQYVSVEACESVANIADKMLDTFDAVSTNELYEAGIWDPGPNVVYSPNYARAIQDLDAAVVTLEKLERSTFEPEAWNTVNHRWGALDQVVGSRRIELELDWFSDRESVNLAWAISRGNARNALTDGVAVLAVIRRYYQARNSDIGSVKHQPQIGRNNSLPLRMLPSTDPINKWVQSIQSAVLQMVLLKRVVDGTNPKSFEVTPEFDVSKYKWKPSKARTSSNRWSGHPMT